MDIAQELRRVGLRSEHMQVASMSSVVVSVGFWMRSKGLDQDERGNAERRALLVGLWAPMFWLIGQSMAESR